MPPHDNGAVIEGTDDNATGTRSFDGAAQHSLASSQSRSSRNAAPAGSRSAPSYGGRNDNGTPRYSCTKFFREIIG